MATPTKAQLRMKRSSGLELPIAPSLVGSGMRNPYSHKSAFQRAMEVYFIRRRGMDTHSFTRFFLFPTNEKTICLAMGRCDTEVCILQRAS